jgi:DNA-binding cell septation regulator SpoVG
MKILRVNSVKSGATKTAAFFDFQTDDDITIRGFRIVNGANGLFVAPPDHKGKDGKYYETIILPKSMKAELQKLALEEFGKLHN